MMKGHQFFLLAFIALISQVTGDHGCSSGWIRLELKCYYLVTASYTFDQFVAYCNRYKYVCGAAQGEVAKDGLKHYASERSTQFWVGLRKINGTWKWNDGTPYVMDEKDWVEGEPSNLVGHDCAYVSPCTGGKYKATSCTSRHYFLREYHGRHGGWGPWSAWGKCSKSCGTGRQKRTRSCNSPSQIAPGSPCMGSNDDYRPCNTHHCTNMYGVCSIWGDPHFITFDRRRFSFQAADTLNRPCKFLLSGRCKNSALPPFEIYGTNRYCGTGTSCPKTVELRYKGHVIKMDHNVRVSGEIWVDELKVFASNYRGIPGLTVTRIFPNSVRLSINNATVYVEFDGKSNLQIGVDSCLRGSNSGLCGLCGNYDGSSANDLYLPDGTANTDPIKFGWSNQLVEPNGYSCQMDTISAQCANPKCSNRSECTPLTNRNYFGTYCVAYYPIADQCGYDMCCSTPKPDRCDIFWDYVTTCQRWGYTVPSTWQRYTKCQSPSCPAHSTYRAGASPCQETCTGLVDGCRDVYVPGLCVCKQGYVWQGNVCVPRNSCGCVDSEGEVHPIGSSWKDRCCKNKYECRNTPRGPEIHKTNFQCHKYARCEIIDGRYGCQCTPGHQRNGTTCEEFGCPNNKPGLYPDPEDCKKYYLCLHGNVTEHKCSSVLRYNHTLQGCTYSSACFDDCNPKYEPGRTPSKRELVDYECPKKNGVFPVARSCTKFYACADGIPTEGECNAEYTFDESHGVCVPNQDKPCTNI